MQMRTLHGVGRARRAVAFVIVALVLAAACTGDDGPGRPTQSPPKRGGSAVFGATVWPDCLNPLTVCNDVWTWFSVLEHVLPRAMQIDLKGNYVASPVLTEAPSLANGLLTTNPFTVTYRISPRAVWGDGSPITSADFEFTWRAVMTTPEAFTTGYDQIESIDTSDPKTALVRFKDVFVGWPEVFGGTFQGLIKESAFPTVDPSKPNLKDEMLDSIPFSGGPWILDSWSKTEAVLVRNDRYWVRDKVPLLDRVTFIPLPDVASEVNALLDGRVVAIHPTGESNVGLDDLLQGGNVKGIAGGTNFMVGLWFNHAQPPLDDVRVREALMNAVDRQAIVDEVVKVKNPNAEVLNCGLGAFPDLGPWCDREYFGEFTYDPQKAIQILESDGYDCSGVPAEPCTRGGRPLSIEISAISSNAGFLAAAAIVERSARDAGIEVKLKNYPDPGKFFGEDGPMGRFTAAIYADGGRIDPSVTSGLACDQFPAEKNEFAGGNWTRWCNPEADRLMKQSDREIDPERRLQLMQRIYDLQVRDRVSLPIYEFPIASGWRTDRIAGPIGAYNSHPSYGLFFNMNEWHHP